MRKLILLLPFILFIACRDDSNKPDDTPRSPSWITYTTENSELASSNFVDLAVDNDNNIWVCVWGVGVQKFDGKNWVTYTPENSGLGYSTHSVVVDNNNNIWIASGVGLQKFDGVNWTTYTSTNSGLVNNNILELAVDKNNNIWIASNGNGLQKFDGVNWITYTQKSSGLGV